MVCLDHRVVHLGGAHDLDERDEVRRVPEVGADDALLVRRLRGDLGDAHHRGVGAEDGRRRTHAVELLEDVLLELEVLVDALDDDVGVAPGGGQVRGRRDAGHGRLDIGGRAEPVLGQEARGSARTAPGARPSASAKTSWSTTSCPASGEDLRDADAHHAGADDGDAFGCHGRPPSGDEGAALRAAPPIGPGSAGGAAAVDGQDLAGDEVRGGGREVHGGADEVLRIGDAAPRDTRQEDLLELRVLDDLLRQRASRRCRARRCSR